MSSDRAGALTFYSSNRGPCHELRRRANARSQRLYRQEFFLDFRVLERYTSLRVTSLFFVLFFLLLLSLIFRLALTIASNKIFHFDKHAFKRAADVFDCTIKGVGGLVQKLNHFLPR